MQRVPITWNTGKFDLDSLENMGTDAIPTLFDASISGFLSDEFSSGIGSANDLFLVELNETDASGIYDEGNYPSGNIWQPRVNTGYFYINGGEYYLFASKGTTVDTPVSGRVDLGTFDYDYPPNGAPIIVTSGNSEFTANDPFGKTYEYTPFNSIERTTNKFRKIIDFTDKKEWEMVDGVLEPYAFNYENMTFTFHSEPNGDQYDWYIMCYPSGFPITVEYETSSNSYYDVDTIDVNPFNNGAAEDVMLSITDDTIVTPYKVNVVNTYRYTVVAANKSMITARVTNIDGSPIIDVEVDYSSDTGSFNPATSNTGNDGCAYTIYTMGAKDSDGAIIVADCDGVIGSGWIQFGKLT